VLVESSVHEKLKEQIVDRARAVRLGFGRDSDATMGPVIHREARDRIIGLAEEALREGASTVYHGTVPQDLVGGSFVAPIVLDATPRSGRLWREEVFGPLIALYTFDTDEQALELANDTDAGLSSFVFTSDESRIRRFCRDLRFGEVQVNGVKYGIELPHLGIKQSGVGCDCSLLALEDYLVKKRVTIATTLDCT
jgi:succinate-semialdehyde dehydrogenase/glutarate-semialdehyde dehydrogenase